MEMYGGFAGVYDRLMDDFDYARWADYYLELIARAGAEAAHICDCGCGTGSMSIALAKRGARITGVDDSVEMLEVASRKARAQAQKITFVKQDMCALTLARGVDAVIAACDGVNYLLSRERVRAFFTSAYRALKPGGCIAFDISSRDKLERVGRGFFGEEREDVAYLWANAYDPGTRIVEMDLTFFIREADGRYRRVRERHRQRAHDAEELANALQECGFVGIHIYGNMTFDAPGEGEERIHFAAVRPREEL